MCTMPFKPRLVQPDDPTRDDAAADDLAQHDAALLNLPADLEQLAEQLTADARHLATAYPAPASDDARRWSARPGMRSIWPAAVAASLLLVAGVWGAARWASVTAPPMASAPSLFRMAADDRSASADQGLPAVLPAMVFEDLSGPEQEGLLDLFEDEAFEQPSLSI
jgi:hypothetical protein